MFKLVKILYLSEQAGGILNSVAHLPPVQYTAPPGIVLCI